jgi:hypothetical protein
MTSMMTVWGPACVIVGLLSIGAATETRASYWNYACKGAIGEAQLLFDRNHLVIMPKKLAQGQILGISDGMIGTFDAADENSGFAPTMVFSRRERIGKITLLEMSSKQTSYNQWNARAESDRRFWDRTTFIKTYRYENDDFHVADIILAGKKSYPDRGEIKMECIDYNSRL